jgi:hypothetical protein
MNAGTDLASAHAEAMRLNIPGRLERLPMTGYQKRIFAVIATAWLADQVDVALLAFLLGTLTWASRPAAGCWRRFRPDRSPGLIKRPG